MSVTPPISDAVAVFKENAVPVNDKPVPAVYVVLVRGTLTYARLFSSNTTAYLVPLSS